jgi:hypothetical protein
METTKYIHKIGQKTKQGNFCHLDNSKNSVSTIAPDIKQREKYEYTCIHIDYN